MRNFKNMIGYLTILLLLSGCVSIPTGDGGKIKVSKDGLEMEDKDGGKSEITFDTDDGGYTLETEDGIAKTGSQAEIPANFPKEILLPENATLILSNETEDNSFMLSYSVEGQMIEDHLIFADYLNENNYEVQEINMGDKIISHQGRKENDHYLNYQMMGQEDNQYQLSIIYGELNQ